MLQIDKGVRDKIKLVNPHNILFTPTIYEYGNSFDEAIEMSEEAEKRTRATLESAKRKLIEDFQQKGKELGEELGIHVIIGDKTMEDIMFIVDPRRLKI